MAEGGWERLQSVAEGRRPAQGLRRPGALIFVDSSAWIDNFNGQATPAAEMLDRLLGREPLVIGDVVLAEVLQGFRRDRDFEAARALLAAFEMLPGLED